MKESKETAVALRALELLVGQIMRRQTAEMEYLRDLRETMARMEKLIGTHDRWERRRSESA